MKGLQSLVVPEKKTGDRRIMITSGNGHRKIIQPIRITSRN